MNWYAERKGIAYNVDNFIELARANPDRFIRYCEIAVTENGLIFLAVPSHREIEKYLRKKGFTNLCMVWYNILECEYFSSAQVKTLEALEASHLLASGLVERYRDVMMENLKEEKRQKMLKRLKDLRYRLEFEEKLLDYYCKSAKEAGLEITFAMKVADAANQSEYNRTKALIEDVEKELGIAPGAEV